MNPLSDYHSYYEFLRKNVQDKPGLPVLVQNAHYIFDSLANLLKDEELPSHLRSKCFIALGYFLIPDDVFPEDEHGAIGFVEDVMLSVFVLEEIEEYLGELGIEIIERSLPEGANSYGELKLDFQKQIEDYQEYYLKALHHTGLISDQEYENLL